MSIPRGTTPMNYFSVPVDLTAASAIYITYAQLGRTVIEKTIDDLDELTEEELAVKLTQDDTLALDASKPVEIQIRARFADGNAVQSNIVQTSVDRVLKDGVI